METKLPPIPEKKYFSISEASYLCGLKAYTLRFWEKEFVQLKPKTRRGKRRFYQKKDLLVARKIRKLLYEEGLTIEGAKKNLTNKKNTKLIPSNKRLIEDLEQILKEIKEIL